MMITRRNPVARALGAIRCAVVRSSRLYTRKGRGARKQQKENGA